MNTSVARVGAEANTYRTLKDLPKPQEKVVASVYKFRDQTGQYKPSLTGANWSTAVTQGGTSILLRALEESQWFMPIERENLGNLLNERKIIRSSRAEFGDNTPLPPLLFAGVMLEGGIISYDANMVTGGAGLRYFGAGASGQYREDRVTVYLRAISTSNGRILKTVYTSKTILSQMVDVGIFRFVKFQRLLEAETGFTYNEPSEMAVKEAIEKAVEGLIIEGVDEGLWSLKNEEDKESEAFSGYYAEKSISQQSDVLGSHLEERRERWSLGLDAGTWLYQGDYPDGRFRPYGQLQVNYKASSALHPFLQIGIGKLEAGRLWRQNLYAVTAGVSYFWFPEHNHSPFLNLGAGVLNNASEDFGLGDSYHPYVKLELGYEFLLDPRFSVNITTGFNQVLSDNLDGVTQGKYYDFFYSGNIGVKYYFW